MRNLLRNRELPMFKPVLLVVALLLGACSYPLATDQPRTEALVWVEQAFSGGRQCEPDDNFQPPDSAELLASAGVVVIETRTEPMMVCMACGCPAYAAKHRALIDAADQGKAAEVGFSPVQE